jgi:hypothetical protein
LLSEDTRQRLQVWVSDFCEGDGLAGAPAVVAEHAPGVLFAWLAAACERRDGEPEDLELEDLRGALVETVARLDVPEAVHGRMCDLARDLLEDLERNGRLADGRELGLAVAAGREAYDRACRGAVEPLTRPGAKIGRNDPCPCGSGKKFKRCCMVR